VRVWTAKYKHKKISLVSLVQLIADSEQDMGIKWLCYSKWMLANHLEMDAVLLEMVAAWLLACLTARWPMGRAFLTRGCPWATQCVDNAMELCFPLPPIQKCELFI